MKKNFRLFILLGFIFIFRSFCTYAQVGINSDNSTPDNSAMLDAKSANKGFLPPRVALTAANVAGPVASPASGLFVYNIATSGTSPNNVVPGYYCWNGTRWVAVVVPQGTNPGDMLYWNGAQWVGLPAGSNGQVLTVNNGVPAWGQPSYPCGFSFTINHIAGAVAPESKTVTYGTIKNIPGETSKCWITSNLGADHQATAVNDASEASAGWYWQFNRKQGYKHDGTTRTPNFAWITSIIESADWSAANDPCALELGAGWRIPTGTEWTNVDASGVWTDWNGPWSSGLKMHAAGNLSSSDGSLLSRGQEGHYWSKTWSSSTYGRILIFYNTLCVSGIDPFTNGFSLRCIREN
jgi:hypothetical protein